MSGIWIWICSSVSARILSACPASVAETMFVSVPNPWPLTTTVEPTSPLVGENDAKKVDVSKIISALLIAFVSLGLLTGATCHGTQSPRHDATLNLQVLTSSLRALQDSEQSLYRAQTIPQLTPDAHKAFNAKMVEVWDATSAAVSVVQAWRPGEPMPAQLAALIEKTRVAVEAAAAVFGAYVPQKITDVWRAIADILLQTLGGAK